MSLTYQHVSVEVSKVYIYDCITALHTYQRISAKKFNTCLKTSSSLSQLDVGECVCPKTHAHVCEHDKGVKFNT